ncbi:ATP-grasp protein [Lactobacillus selangorensis]|uniref:ATP-grasp protein n=1 Tax=Lactobacillus selangorensis TaxID=81857 RepID=A0A0R2FYN0_9LACO|nr:carboxylate--amine ligase [Lactobacillus selangorensis]KRN29058.1 ATP-grasp protein [Lactobacillus selangorensis]KRN30029.1 ATP-grasp protein [Lactobacillus selangorensis]
MAQAPQFTPVLLGSDMNVYGMARAFNEAYGISVDAYAEANLAPTRYSKIVHVHYIEGFTEDPGFSNAMQEIAAKYATHPEPVFLIACGDGYAELISKHKEELAKTFICPYVDYSLLKRLNDKESFYHVCDEFGLPYPKTKIITRDMYENDQNMDVPFDYPISLKPANSVEWLDIHFEGRKKAFTIHSEDEYRDIIAKIYDNGYLSDVILQDYIPGDDSNMRVLNVYVDQYHKVKMMCLGHPLLEDPTPAAIGNYVAIIPDYSLKIYKQIQAFLEKINYTGFANFDMKYDRRDKQFKLFEINIRQGRSSFFVTLNGYNLASYLVNDYVTKTLADTPIVYGNKDKSKYQLWLGVPKRTFEKYAANNKAKKAAMYLIHHKRYGTTVFYKNDMNPKRWVLLQYMFFRYVKRYREYFAENKGRKDQQ